MLKKLFQSRFLLALILFIYICVSHIFLPLAGKKDFLFFFTWSLFDDLPPEEVYDISWDEGRTFLFRDYKAELSRMEIDTNRLFYMLKPKKKHLLIRYFYPQLARLCECKNLKLFELKGSLSDHIIYKKKLEVQKQISL